ncbi:MAG: cytochrome-c peroxidase, partial [Nitrospirae bacterium]
MKSLWLGSLPPPPPDYSNKYASDPGAIALGRKFFFDSRFSGNMKVSCATCHPENMNFADNLPRAHGMGTTKRRTMPLIGVAYSPWLFWDGRKDSLWAQALGPIESPVEHGFTRTQVAVVIKKHYKKDYEDVFGPLPDFDEEHLPLEAKPSPEDPMALKAWVTLPDKTRQAINRIYVNFGKAIGAFVRTIMPTPSRFDHYVEAVLKGDLEKASKILNPDEVKGLRLFIGKARCINCHNGPMFTDYDFHNIGVPQPPEVPVDNGRADGIVQVLTDEFNCLSPYSDAIPRQCRDLRFMSADVVKYKGAFKTPTLRNVAERAPYMHAGQFATLHDVLHFYRDMPEDSRPPDLEHGSLT